MRKVLITKFIVILNALISLPSHANNEDNQDTTIRAITAEFPPFEILENGKLVGTDTDVIRAVIEQLGYKITFENTTWENAQLEAKAGNYDIIYTFNPTEERSKIYYFSDTLLMTRVVFFKRKSDKITWENMKDLTGHKISASKGYDYGNDFNTALANGYITTEETHGDTPEITSLLKVGLGKTDLFPCEINVCRYLLGKYKDTYDVFANIDYIDKNVTPSKPGIAGFPKVKETSEALQKEFNARLKIFQKTQEYKDLLKKYNINIDTL